MSEGAHQFPCPGCGGGMVFNAENQSLTCSYCGNVINISNDEYTVVREYPIESAKEMASVDWGGQTAVIHCDSCGAETIIQANQLTADCAFCGSVHIRLQEQGEVLSPETLIPFKIDKRNAISKYKDWLKKRWLAPRNLKVLARDEKMSGVYIPFWTYDADTDSFYTAEKGTYYYVTEMVYVTDSSGKRSPQQKRVRKTRWSYTSGAFRHFFDDVLVCASQTEGKNLIKKLEPFHLKELVAYRNEYLSGFMAEKYCVGLEQGFNEAKSTIRSNLNKMIHNQILADEIRNLRIQTSYSNVTFKHILLPIWISAYRYKDKIYKFLVNGQTGMVKGQAPVSAIKVALLILAGLIIVGAIYLISQNT